MKRLSFHAKKVIAIICLFVFILSSVSCAMPEDKVLISLGEYEDHAFYSSGGFQDYTDYAKYYYTSAKVTGNKYLKKIQETDFVAINKHLDDFEEVLESLKRDETSSEVVVNYDFNREIIDTEDYIYMESEEHTWGDGHTALVRYNVYFFDTQTHILYYFHNNI